VQYIDDYTIRIIEGGIKEAEGIAIFLERSVITPLSTSYDFPKVTARISTAFFFRDARKPFARGSGHAGVHPPLLSPSRHDARARIDKSSQEPTPKGN
jgi:hypothetical protein